MQVASPSVAGILLCGGSSRRMGLDKTQLVVDGSTLAVRTAKLLTRVTESAVEVGPGRSGLPSRREEPPGEGPLAAVAAGWDSLRDGDFTAAIVVAADLPFLSERLLRLIAGWATAGSVIPVVNGRDQPLCARWSREDLDKARVLLARGGRSLRFLAHRTDVTYLDESSWGAVATEREFADVDTPEDLRRLGLDAARVAEERDGR